MKITYFFRHPKVGHSIHRVFRTILQELNNSLEIETHDVPNIGSMPIDIIRNNLYTYKKRDQKAIHHVTGHIHDVLLSLIGVKTVLTVHDLVFLDNVKNPFKRFYKWLFWLYLPIKLADKVVCISNQTKNNILKKIDTKKLSVIHNAVDPIFKHTPHDFNEDKPVILHIGTGWNKNLELTIQALNNVSCHLRIIGKISELQTQLLINNHIDFSNESNLTDEQIKQEYINCDIVNFPSKYEGFGMPVIEGQQTGRIVVTSKIEPIIEIANDAVAFVIPNDVNSLRNTYLKIIKNPIFRNNIIEKGLTNAKRFSVETIALKYINLYQDLDKE
ncbi:Glycosyltransferase involved in cell wall bisynthesis [Maribacter dokdonensis]|uniref:Glycosyltransferase involved in cell wall bisynthesis n=1 Tax=Maribacter dokdonensis TaxID=320912 RepID=A0ABY0UUI5_9FLAO|nr:glycosyltransferase family 1 protein [Maribacter dokdonensis]SDT19649.1 Glycosyltransferase involved in cell wall bisynthesis [Maribacter dokdonensis]